MARANARTVVAEGPISLEDAHRPASLASLLFLSPGGLRREKARTCPRDKAALLRDQLISGEIYAVIATRGCPRQVPGTCLELC